MIRRGVSAYPETPLGRGSVSGMADEKQDPENPPETHTEGPPEVDHDQDVEDDDD